MLEEVEREKNGSNPPTDVEAADKGELPLPRPADLESHGNGVAEKQTASTYADHPAVK